MSRAVRLGIGLVALIPVMAITGGALVAADVEGLTVGWITLGVGVLWMILIAVWAMRVPPAEGAEDRNWGVFGSRRFK